MNCTSLCLSVCLCFSVCAYACVYNGVALASVAPKRYTKSIWEKIPPPPLMLFAESIISTVCLWSCSAATWRRRAFTLSPSIKTELTNKTKKKNLLKDTLVCRRTKEERSLIKIHSVLWMCVMTRLNSSVLGYFFSLSTFAFYRCNQCWFNTSDLMWHFIPAFLVSVFFWLYYWGEKKSPILKGSFTGDHTSRKEACGSLECMKCF